MKHILIFLILISFVSCQQKQNKDDGIGYTGFINSKTLVKSIVDKYPGGQEKAVVYFLDENISQKPVKEIHYLENGNTQVEGTLKNGARHGTWVFYHKNGKVWSTGEFDMGKSVGEFKIYDKEGQIKFKHYYENNTIVKEEYFLDGKLYKTVDKSNDTSNKK